MKIYGKVVRGKGKGKKLGYPTANVRLKERIESGVYKGRVITREWGANGERMRANEWPAGIFVGNGARLLEAYLIGFSGDLYGKKIEVEIGEKIRDVIKLENDKVLREQIADDIRLISKSQLI